jgi:glucose-1-phosphate thymidylyltransferase
MKGIILAGGFGSRLFPITKAISKQLLPVFDKPMIYYPISVLMLAGIKDILIITTPNDKLAFQKLLGNGSNFGINLNFATQSNPDGIAQAFIIGEEFIGKDNVCLILGDNIFYGQGFTQILQQAVERKSGSTIFAYQVKNPQEFGIVEFNNQGQAISIEEKPFKPKSNFAVTGLYFYDNDVVNIAKTIETSERGELEITFVNQIYLKNNNLHVQQLGRGFAWLDTGTQESLLNASQFVETIENRQGFKIGCLEEIAFNKGWLSKKDLLKIIQNYPGTKYSKYLFNLLQV